MANKVQRGSIIRTNDFGTLERVGRTNTYIGSTTLPDGKVITKRFRCTGFDEEEVARRWRKWQGRESEKNQDIEEIIEEEEEADMADNNTTIASTVKNPCPFSGVQCSAACPLYSVENGRCAILLGGVGLYNMAANLMRLDMTEPLELLALAVSEISGTQKTVDQPAVESKSTAKHVPTVAEGIDAYLADKTFISFVNLHSKTVYQPYKKFCEQGGFPVESESNFTKVIKERYPELKPKGQAGGCVFMAA